MNTPTKNKNRCCEKTRRDVLKTAEATGDQVGNKIADKIISVGKTKSNIKMEYQKIIKLIRQYTR